MTQPITPVPAIKDATKAWVAAVLSTLATILFAAAPFLPEDLQPAAYAVGAVVGVIGVPFGVYISVNKPVTPKV